MLVEPYYLFPSSAIYVEVAEMAIGVCRAPPELVKAVYGYDLSAWGRKDGGLVVATSPLPLQWLWCPRGPCRHHRKSVQPGRPVRHQSSLFPGRATN